MGKIYSLFLKSTNLYIFGRIVSEQDTISSIILRKLLMHNLNPLTILFKYKNHTTIKNNVWNLKNISH